MSEILRLRVDELTENPAARVPISLVLDTSGSMGGEKIKELNAAIAEFLGALRNDPMAAASAEVNVITFGETVTKVADFCAIERQNMPALWASGRTPMGQAVQLALGELDQAKRVYQEMGVDYYQPWLVLMTDGEPTDDVEAAIRDCQQRIRGRKLTVFPIAIGRDANLGMLARFSPDLPPMRMNAAHIAEFFKWLSASVTRVVSTSTPGDDSGMKESLAILSKKSVTWAEAMR